ncbi:prefoldin subunit [Colletotrichum paranaense]|uniref:Prefoldin subunit n=11 Tax=Colletotrichum acutatum species complex TaxID=2707335 RepID=A0A9P7UFE0_9PEZI|nr:prefoldin subunit [Colletotrichum scovillei]XP_049148844.1 prefoldin subunit [Colletotrichum lupini]XP_060310023.1 prefoldin subunit [Colletotrichum costaricense]XP_060342812.1 prefoldin subunit [Colletotrichum paranaense]XP_060381310.1 prefoldin subunit [Colletotrichum tamarilloi]XP_060402902.1 prefoldin subunit [Colletotrichum abscissum]KAI3544695.1 prefoldin subunit [Colletotrichum filicis]KAK0374758.1 prefoldin subunit [Colletotrichum limetticola]KAK1461692.1 prefoldin subunit [Colle
MAEVQAKLQKLSEEYQALQQELQTTVQSRQKLEAQRQENLGVKEEFDKLKDGEQIYKLVGPVLLKQDKVEAESTVKGRLDFITKEIERHEGLIRDAQGKLEKKKGDIIQIQTSAQAAAAQAQKA